MAHLCVPQNQALGVCRGFVPDIQICGTHRRKNLVDATIIPNAKEKEEEGSFGDKLFYVLTFLIMLSSDLLPNGRGQ